MKSSLLTHVNITQCPNTGMYTVTVNDTRSRNPNHALKVKTAGKVARIIIALLLKYPRLRIYTIGVVSPIQLAQSGFTEVTGKQFQSKVILNGGGSCLTT